MSLPRQLVQRTEARKWTAFLHNAIFFFLALFVVLLPHSEKGARHAWVVAFWIWLAALAFEHKRLLKQPLVLPLFAYVLLSGISTALSPDPYLSWGYMRLVCYTAMLGTLVAQYLNRLSQVRTLLLLLLLSASAAAGFTAWQYTYGIGVRADGVGPGTPLYTAGLRSDDIVTAIDGEPVHTPAQLVAALRSASPGSTIPIKYLHGVPTERRFGIFTVPPTGIATSTVQFSRAHPIRAQGTFRHYGIFAEVLMPMACLAWAMLLGYFPKHRIAAVGFGLIFVAITATVFATQTRAALAGLLAGCMVTALLLARRRARLVTLVVLALLALGATLWVYHARGLSWIAPNDAGTQYRLLMWQDGMRLAAQHPFFGVGMDTIQNHWREWHIRAFEQYHVYYNFHSDVVQLAAERGYLTLAAWIWFALAYLAFLIRLFRKARAQNRFAMTVVVGILSGFVAYFFPSLVESALNDSSLVMLIFFSFGVALAIDRMLRQPGAVDVEL